ncbi:MAG: hypothetical protein P8184_18960 [Calditrichia bacterium]
MTLFNIISAGLWIWEIDFDPDFGYDNDGIILRITLRTDHPVAISYINL